MKKIKGIIWFHMLIVFFCSSSATGLGWFFRYLNFPETNIVVVYILSVIITARLTKGYLYGILATIVATFAFNYFFTEPYFTLLVNDPTYFITFTIMTFTSIIISALTSKVKKQFFEAQRKEKETAALYRLTNHLTDAEDITEIARIVTKTISDILNCQAACLCFDENGEPEQSFIQQKNKSEQVRRKVDDCEKIKHRIENLRTTYDEGKEFVDWPIYGKESILGIIRLPINISKAMKENQIQLLQSTIESTALAMDRFRSVQDRIKSREAIVQEKYRSNLLCSISHDLRTPLAGIMGTSEMILDMSDKSDNRYKLFGSIYKEAEWLYSLVENILSLTRLNNGKLNLNKSLEAVEEVIAAALSVIEKRAPKRNIEINIPEEVMLVPMEAKLIEQVLVNLLDNAVKHTPIEKEISIIVKEDKKNKLAIFSIIDSGEGISKKDFPNIFQMFYTTHKTAPDAERGIGLGLTICESIINAHNGTIEAHNRKAGLGSEFIFTLPMENNYEK